ncbi:MAG: cyanophycin synthetase family protein [Candidatus Polarisedimenticolia bacterium]
MSDEGRLRFRDKIRRRPGTRPAGDADTAPAGEMTAPAGVPDDAVVIRGLECGPFPQAEGLHPRFVPGVPRILMTIDVGAALRRPGTALPEEARRRLLAVCPCLGEHECGQGDPFTGAPAVGSEDEDGLALAHLIEHVAIDIAATATARRCSGVTCAWRGRLDRFDIFLECHDPAVARTAAILGTAVVRDLASGSDRLGEHGRCRDLLCAFARQAGTDMAPEDAARILGTELREALGALEDLKRCGYVQAVPSPFTFSSATGLLYRRTPPPAAGVP